VAAGSSCHARLKIGGCKSQMIELTSLDDTMSTDVETQRFCLLVTDTAASCRSGHPPFSARAAKLLLFVVSWVYSCF
jgi:hypothetical protein